MITLLPMTLLFLLAKAARQSGVPLVADEIIIDKGGIKDSTMKPWLVGLDKQLFESELVRTAIQELGGVVKKKLTLINALSVDLPESVSDTISTLPGVRYVEADKKLSLFNAYTCEGGTGVPNPGHVPWGVTHVQAEQMWAEGFTGKGVTVCVVDGGVDHSHPDFMGATIDSIPSTVCNHGMHVIGTIIAQGTNGIKGIAPDATLYSVKVLEEDCSGAMLSALIDGIGECVLPEVASKVITVAMGFDTDSKALEEAVKAATDSGALVVAAAGNVNSGAHVYYPAAYSDVISVAAINNVNDHLDWSVMDYSIDISAPGADICSTVQTDGDLYQSWDGTSSAAAHVSGVAALLIESKPTVSMSWLRYCIKYYGLALPLSNNCPSYSPLYCFGNGLVQAYDAYQCLQWGV